MKIILFGASGMVGQGVLRECLIDPEITNVLAIGRSTLKQQNKKFREIIHSDLFNLTGLEEGLRGYDACFFCMGVSSAGMNEAGYHRVTYDLTMVVARMLATLNSAMTFIYVSGMGTDSTERGRTMWARVKGKTENALLKLPFKAYMFRPAVIQPLHGIRSKTLLYQIPYVLLGPFIPLFKKLLPNFVTTTEQVGRAMIHIARKGAPKRVLETQDINNIV